MFGIGMQELLIILVLVLVIFGAKRLPEIGAGLGKAIRNFKQGATEPDEIDLTVKRAESAQSKADTQNIDAKESTVIHAESVKTEEKNS